MITIKNTEEIEIIREGGKILAKIMRELEKMVKPGIVTKELDRLAESLILKSGGQCSFKGHEDFPACLCASINEEIVHGIPSDRELKEGDIISLDLGIFYKGFHTDMAVTLPVGKVNPEAARLIRVTKKALKKGIKEVIPGNTFGDISNAIQDYVESQDFYVVRDLCGHGIGIELHEEPQILNYGKRGVGPKIKEGMVFCLEPMVAIGDGRSLLWSRGRASLASLRSRSGPLAGKIKKAKDGYGWQTADGSLSAHFEQTIAATKDGCRVLTKF